MLRYSFFRYGLVGVLSVFIDFFVLFVCFSMLKFEQNTAISIAFILSTVFNFYMHRNFTFREKESDFKTQLIRYILLISMSYFITILSINYLVNMRFDLYISKLLSVCFVYI